LEVVRQVGVVGAGAEGELNYFHPREASRSGTAGGGGSPIARARFRARRPGPHQYSGIPCFWKAEPFFFHGQRSDPPLSQVAATNVLAP
jgi:hypothetical protein